MSEAELRAKCFGFGCDAPALHRQLDAANAEIEAWRNKPWAEQLREQAKANAKLRAQLLEQQSENERLRAQVIAGVYDAASVGITLIKTEELKRMRAELATYKDAQKQPLAQSESTALVWMNRALSAEAELATARNALHRIAITDDVDCAHANDAKVMTRIAREALKREGGGK